MRAVRPLIAGAGQQAGVHGLGAGLVDVDGFHPAALDPGIKIPGPVITDASRRHCGPAVIGGLGLQQVVQPTPALVLCLVFGPGRHGHMLVGEGGQLGLESLGADLGEACQIVRAQSEDTWSVRRKAGVGPEPPHAQFTLDRELGIVDVGTAPVFGQRLHRRGFVAERDGDGTIQHEGLVRQVTGQAHIAILLTHDLLDHFSVVHLPARQIVGKPFQAGVVVTEEHEEEEIGGCRLLLQVRIYHSGFLRHPAFVRVPPVALVR